MKMKGENSILVATAALLPISDRQTQYKLTESQSFKSWEGGIKHDPPTNIRPADTI